MRKLKKAVSLFLTAAMALSFAACGGSSSTAGASSSASSAAGSSEAASTASSAAADADSDMAYVKDKGTLVVGMTDFAPMDYRDDNGEWIGFDADMAKAFAKYLGVDVEFPGNQLGQQADGAGHQGRWTWCGTA